MGYNSDKAYQDEESDKSFIQRSHLRKHQAIHRGEKPYKCQECHMSFTYLFDSGLRLAPIGLDLAMFTRLHLTHRDLLASAY